MHVLYICAQSGVNYLYSRRVVGSFLCVPHLQFQLGKLSSRAQSDQNHRKQITVNGDALSLDLWSSSLDVSYFGFNFGEATSLLTSRPISSATPAGTWNERSLRTVR